MATDPHPAIAGHALLEVLVSMLLLAFGALGVAAGLTAALRLQQGAGAAQAALGLAADAGERLRAVPSPAQATEGAAWRAAALAQVARWPGRPWRAGGVIDLRPASTAERAAWRLQLRWVDRAAGLPRRFDSHLAAGAAP